MLGFAPLASAPLADDGAVRIVEASASAVCALTASVTAVTAILVTASASATMSTSSTASAVCVRAATALIAPQVESSVAASRVCAVNADPNLVSVSSAVSVRVRRGFAVIDVGATAAASAVLRKTGAALALGSLQSSCRAQSQTRTSALAGVSCIVTVSARLLWEAQPDTSETWVEQLDTDEIWSKVA